MTTEEETVNKESEPPIRHQLGKLLAGATAGFLATKLIEKAYDAWLARDSQKVTDSDR